ncbi:hypothetical protein RAS12_30570 (plasmid) [Achromobacter seleniivolatilans]|uniref:Uncharacterized protein n=1 Tax=Achromobacter seleniivolatilans TaxID=3047478 RepID=A0ABY9MAU0_9BURK|nr:hypothetical protein [Achromobacter sp. R39]WMD23980.1 hypothetical protein RAS12_30570 [Achromobacter sp. R39]
MAIISNTSGRPTDYIQLTFGANAKAPLGMSLANKDFTDFSPVHGVGGQIRHVHVRTKAVGNKMMETCTLYFADDGEERGTALQFATGGPEAYSFAAGHLVAKLLACRPDDEIRIMAYVFRPGTEGKDRNGNAYIRKDPELAVPVSANGHKILQPNWGVDDRQEPLTRGPDAPFIINPTTGRPTESRDYSAAREWMTAALHGLKFSFNRRSHAESHQAAHSGEISADDLPEHFDSQDYPTEQDHRTGGRAQSAYQGQRG